MTKVFLTTVLLATIGYCCCNDLIICPDASQAVVTAADVQKEVPGSLGTVTLDIRVPESGLLAKSITCISVTDMSTDGDGGEVSITEGGVGSEYVRVRMVSQLWKGLNYRIQVYTAS